MEAPKFIMFKINGDLTTAMRLKDGVYYRDGGNWSTRFKIKGDKIFAVSSKRDISQTNGLELVEVTEAEWREDNGRYAPESI